MCDNLMWLSVQMRSILFSYCEEIKREDSFVEKEEEKEET